MTGTVEEAYGLMLRWRDIEPGDACGRCNGTGVRMYPNTTTWYGGMGGQMITNGVCDSCWGSGSASRPWTNLRSLRADVNEKIRAEAATYLARSLGTGINHLRPALARLSGDLELMGNKRTVRPTGYHSLCRYLAQQLDNFSKAPPIGGVPIKEEGK